MHPRYEKAITRGSGLEMDRIEEFWALPYSRVIDIAKDTARGGESGQRYNLNTDFVLSLPDQPMPQGDAVLDLVTQKIFFHKVYQRHFLNRVAHLSLDEMKKIIEPGGMDRIDRAMASDQPVCLTTGHVGAGHTIPYLLSRLGYPITHLGPHNVFKTFELPEHEAIEFCPTNEFQLQTIATSVAALNARRIVFSAADGRDGSSGTDHTFLGKLHNIPNGFAYLAAKTGAIVLPIISTIDPDGRMSIKVHDALEPHQEDEPDGRKMQHYASGLLEILEWYWINKFGNIPNRFVRQHLGRPDVPTARTTTG